MNPGYKGKFRKISAILSRFPAKFAFSPALRLFSFYWTAHRGKRQGARLSGMGFQQGFRAGF